MTNKKINLLNNLGYVSRESYMSMEDKINQNSRDADRILAIIADLIRFNTLLSVARAGTGHLGASLSMIEVLTEVYFRSFDLNPENLKLKNRDIFILSKGHGAPSLYATLAAKGYFPTEELDRLRRLGGLAGHPDIETPGIEANTGSLAMGLSKAVGYAIAKKRFRLKGDVIVIVGNGELQEGQCWEALLSAASFRCDNLYIIIDDNKVQTDQYTRNIVKYGDFIKSFQALGLAVIEGRGKSIDTIYQIFKKLKKIQAKPKIFYCHTIKGQAVPFMEHPNVLKKKADRYIWHNKSLNRQQLEVALNEVVERNKKILTKLGFQWDLESSLSHIPITLMQTDIKGDNLITGLKEGLTEEGKKNKKIVVLDADLEEDCGFTSFHQRLPKRFFEMGIMEQHMVSVASAMARIGYLPVFSSYAAFITSRANEQLYNLASEGGKALIIGNMSGVIPATPGKSHQAFRDIACMKNIPGIVMYQPITANDVKNILNRYFKGDLGKLLYLRLSMAASAVRLTTPNKSLKIGEAQVLKRGQDAVVIGCGPVILGECMIAAEELSKKGIEIEVWNYPWLVDFNDKVLVDMSKRERPLIIVEDHFIKGGMGESFLAASSKAKINYPKIAHLALTDFPKTGFRQEALKTLGIDRNKIRAAILSLLQFERNAYS